MICRQCGTEIADKAIVCYRCGTGTADPVRKPADIRRRRSPLVPAVVVLIIVAVLAWFAARHYHVFGVELYPVGSVLSLAEADSVNPLGSEADQNPAFAMAVLIDFPTIDA